MPQRGKMEKALCSESCDFCIGHRAEPYKALFLWLCAKSCGILNAENNLSGRRFSWRRRQSTRKRLFLARRSIRMRVIGLSEHPARASSMKKSFLTPTADLLERSAKASWARNTILTKTGILSRLPVTAFSEPRSQLIRTGNTWGRAIRGWDQIRSLSSMEKRMIRRSSILALLLVCSSLSSALSSLF